jgi:hypothetical protein
MSALCQKRTSLKCAAKRLLSLRGSGNGRNLGRQATFASRFHREALPKLTPNAAICGMAVEPGTRLVRSHDPIRRGDFNMRRLALSLALFSTALLGAGAMTAMPGRTMAFELDTAAVTVPGATTRFDDPDGTPLPAPLPSARLDEAGASLPTEPSTTLQLAPGTTLQIGPGTGLQMAPSLGESSNPADDRALIPRP